MKKKYNIWHIEGYAGWSDYDGPSDCNYSDDWVLDAHFKKESVINMFYNLHQTSRYVAVHKCEIIKSGEIEY